jgi:hypothetical protein
MSNTRGDRLRLLCRERYEGNELTQPVAPFVETHRRAGPGLDVNAQDRPVVFQGDAHWWLLLPRGKTLLEDFVGRLPPVADRPGLAPSDDVAKLDQVEIGEASEVGEG